MTTVTLDLPDDVFSALRRSPQDFGREMRAWRLRFIGISEGRYPKRKRPRSPG